MSTDVALTWEALDHTGLRIARVILNRPEKANAFTSEMIAELTRIFKQAAAEPNCRLLILQGHGKHFSAGADLEWMRTFGTLSCAENLVEAQKLREMFLSLYTLNIPVLAFAQGSVFGGAVGLLACADMVWADQASRFSLSEVRLGLLPAVIYPFLAAKVGNGMLRRMALSGEVIDAVQAQAWQLVDVVTTEPWSAASSSAMIHTAVQNFLKGGFMAQQQIKKVHRQICHPHVSKLPESCEWIAAARASTEGQEGLKAFKEKRIPAWTTALPKDWRL